MDPDCLKLKSLYNWKPHEFLFEQFFTATQVNGTSVVDLTGLSCPGDNRFVFGTPFLTNAACEILAAAGTPICQRTY